MLPSKKGVIILEVITIEDKRYPKQLKNIENPPKQLYAQGNIELLNTNIISIIGSRACSDNGKELAQKFSRELVYQNITIASGMAVGIDTIAHQTTLQEKGKTIAVLGNGFNCIFPKENIELYHEIIENEGLVITEYPPEEKTESRKFLERNRIVSGLALGILVIEAAHRSGTSVTARLAKKQGRKVFALPHEVNDKHGIGTNRLIREGAKMVTCTEDIIQDLSFLSYKKPPEEKTNNEPILINHKRKICKDKKYNTIYQYIMEKPISLNEIYRKVNKNVTEINDVLLMLELEGYIEKVVGGYRCISDKR